jgi:hypothetical protein
MLLLNLLRKECCFVFFSTDKYLLAKRLSKQLTYSVGHKCSNKDSSPIVGVANHWTCSRDSS